jgi:hypothetical protein
MASRAGVMAVPAVVAPAGQVAPIAIGAAVVGGLALAGWLASKAFATHPPSFQARIASGVPVDVNQHTIALMQAQLHWMGTHPIPAFNLRTAAVYNPDVPVVNEDILTTTFSPSAMAAYSAVRETGQFDDATIAALANVSTISFISESMAQQDPTPRLMQVLATQDGQQAVLDNVDELYMLWTQASQSSQAVAPKPAGQALPANAPPGAFGVDSLGQCVDVSGNVLDASGQTLGPGNTAHAGATMCGLPVPVQQTQQTTTTTTTTGIAPPTLPSGLPTGTVQQLGSSITPKVVAIAVGGVLLVGALAYVLTRTAPVPAPAPVRAARTGRNYEKRARRRS